MVTCAVNCAAGTDPIATRAHEIVRDQHAAAAHPVDPRTGRQADQQEAERLERGERPDLQSAGVDDGDRDQR